VEQAVAALGRIDILVNCVGDALKTPLDTAGDDEIEQALNLNLVSAILCCRAVGPLLAAQGGGKVVNSLRRAPGEVVPSAASTPRPRRARSRSPAPSRRNGRRTACR
jgi:NAD(P)-dependent dehydrogenase (short-subunit alcohol dehydrogenase family)